MDDDARFTRGTVRPTGTLTPKPELEGVVGVFSSAKTAVTSILTHITLRRAEDLRRRESRGLS